MCCSPNRHLQREQTCPKPLRRHRQALASWDSSNTNTSEIARYFNLKGELEIKCTSTVSCTYISLGYSARNTGQYFTSCSYFSSPRRGENTPTSEITTYWLRTLLYPIYANLAGICRSVTRRKTRVGKRQGAFSPREMASKITFKIAQCKRDFSVIRKI